MKTSTATTIQLNLIVKKVANLSAKPGLGKGPGVTTLPTTMF